MFANFLLWHRSIYAAADKIRGKKMSDDKFSILQSAVSIEEKLERARMELLDLSARNRLLNIPRSKTAKHIEIVDELSAHVYRLLVQDSKVFTFVPSRSAKSDEATESAEESKEILLSQLAQLDENDEVDPSGQRARHVDTKLQTRLSAKGLQTRLLDLYHDARTLEEEQGVNILFLALGTLKWIDPNNKENVRFAPLVLVPVELARGAAGERFRLKARPEDQTGNLSLEAYLDRVHKLKLPEFSGGDDFDVSAYMRDVAAAIATKPDWSVQQDEIVLGFFSFAKFLMYRDLDPSNWPEDGRLSDQPIVRSLLGGGFPASDSLVAEDTSIDQHISPREMLHIVDSDSSQALAVHDVRQGRNLVIQGPPGTGKSQTIANVIASAIADGKTVLFVAEKMAALEVVKRRLDQAGVGDACLELHSHKANKRAVLEELRRTWDLGSPKGSFADALVASLAELRDILNDHATRLHVPHGASGFTPYQIIGSLVRLRANGQLPTHIQLERARNWTADDLEKKLALLGDLLERLQEIGIPDEHPWRGVGLESILPTDLDRMLPPLHSLYSDLTKWNDELVALASRFELHAPQCLIKDVVALNQLAKTVAAAPSLAPQALASKVWNQISALLHAGSQLREKQREMQAWLLPEAIDVPCSTLPADLDKLPNEFDQSGFTAASELSVLLPRLQVEAQRLAKELGTKGAVGSLAEVIRLATTGERVALAPDACPEAFVATIWEQGVDQAAVLVQAVASLSVARVSLADKVLDAAWDTDLAPARQTLATQTGMFRFLSGDWRKAKALVKSLVRDPNQQIPSLVSLLDELAQGQKAMSHVRAGDAFGRSAFGTDWQGERSQSASLLALVEWMRTLRGLGAEPRILASQMADKSGVKIRSELVKRLIAQATVHLSTLWDALGDKTPELFNDDVAAERVPLAAWQKSVESIVSVDQLLTRLISVRPATNESIKRHVAQILELQAIVYMVDQSADLGASAFAEAFEGRNSSWEVLQQAFDWLVAHPEERVHAARIHDRIEVAALTVHANEAAGVFQTRLTQMAEVLKADATRIFATADSNDFLIDAARKTMESWLANSEQLSKWVAYRHQARKASEAGMDQLVAELATGQLQPVDARPTLEMAYYEDQLQEVTEANPDVARFDGALHSRDVGRFVELDRSRIKAACVEVARAHHRGIPSREGGAGPVGVLRGEMAKRRGHIPIRQLMQRAGPAIQAIKPVMMMSPLSVAQFLIPGKQTFDLLVMDEASQIQPVDAIGAIARAKQVVVVGDERQLPPTKFFSKMTGSESEDDNEETQVTDIESILGLFVARGLPQRMLRWHYRSRHQSLIAVSNSQFYENKLIIVPSPYTSEAGMGLQFRFVPDGFFDSGATGTNIVEAKAVAKAILQHAIDHPELSLGVATFSVAQRRVIQDELELLRRLNPDAESFFFAHPSEPFFVKNLENVQGDERDVIMISVGYAKNAQGTMAMRFGPLGADGGERRLNVLISRAKRRCEVFSSITDEDIDLERAKGKGVFAFKLFLHYARTGRISMVQPSKRALDGVFEEQVAEALQRAGYQVHSQVGIAGLFIDLAIADPERPGRYLIGIECDGLAYHSARSARDRDRLRQAVLEDHGWIIHRIWSTDWFQRPQEQLDRTIAAVEAAKKTLDERSVSPLRTHRAVPVEIITVDRDEVTEIGLVDASDNSMAKVFYLEATPERHTDYEIHETPIGFMSDLVAKVVDLESPLHFDELVVRLRGAWGLQRAGARIEAAVARAVDAAHKQKSILRSGPFLTHPTRPPLLRDRQLVQSLNLRKPEMIAPEEIAVGVLDLIRKNLGATDDEIAVGVARGLGFKNTSAPLKNSVNAVVLNLLASNSLRRDTAMIVIGDASAS
jgi:very-short-patch-repair endonuclease